MKRPVLSFIFTSALGSLMGQSSFNQIASFSTTSPAEVSSGLVKMADGKLYGLSPFGGSGEGGCLFSVEPANGTTVIVDGSLGSAGVGFGNSPDSVVGMAASGTTFLAITINKLNEAKLWKWTAATGVEVLHNFSDAASVISSPVKGMVVRQSGMVLGAASVGGTVFGVGGLWRWTPAGGFEIETEFDPSATGDVRPRGIALDASGNIYGVGQTDTNDTSAASVIWKYDGTTQTPLYTTAAGVVQPNGTIAVLSTGEVVGLAHGLTSGSTLPGKLWKLTTGGVFSTLRTFTGEPRLPNPIVIDAGNNIYGASEDGGTGRNGYFWRVTSTGTFTSLFACTATTGASPVGSLVLESSTIYGVTRRGGMVSGTYVTGPGKVWKWSASTNAQVVTTFVDPPAGLRPSSIMLDVSGAFFGYSVRSDNSSNLWRYRPAEGLQKVGAFEPFAAIGDKPKGSIVSDGSGALFGVTTSGGLGTLNGGALWKWGASTGLAKLASLGTASAPGRATGALAIDSSGNLYGVSSDQSSTPTNGALWKVTPAGVITRLTILIPRLHGTNIPRIVLEGDTVYGLASNGGGNGQGVLWKWNNTSGLEVLVNFGAATDDVTSSSLPFPSDLIKHPNGKLYGYSSGPVIWQWTPSDGVVVEVQITDAPGDSMPVGLSVFSNGTMHGACQSTNAAGMPFLWSWQPGDSSSSKLHSFADTVSQAPDATGLAYTFDGRVIGVAPNILWSYGAAAPAGGPPVVSTLPPAFTSGTRVSASATVNANLSTATISFQYGLSSTTLTTSVPGSPPSATGSSITNVTADFTQLKPATTYYYRIVAENQHGRSFGDVLSFKTLAAVPPVVSTTAATSFTSNAAQPNGSVNAKGHDSVVAFDYGLSATALTNSVSVNAVVSGTTVTPVGAAISGLMPHTKYFFRVRALSDFGSATGATHSFTTMNSMPTGVADSGIIALPKSPITIPVCSNDTDADGDPLTVSSFTAPPVAQGTITKSVGNLTFLPSASFTGPVNITYVAKDAFGGSTAATAVSVTRGTCQALPASFNAPSGTFELNDIIGTVVVRDVVNVTANAPFAVDEALSWVTVGEQTLGSVELLIAGNTSGTPRSGTVKIGGETHTINQAGVVAPTTIDVSSFDLASILGDRVLLVAATDSYPSVFTVTGGALPPGLTLSSTGVLSGRPNKVGDFTFRVKVANSAGSITSTPVTIQVTAFPSAVAGAYVASVDIDSDVTEALGGYLKLNVTAVGTLTGSLIIKGAAMPMVATIVDGNGEIGDPLPKAVFEVKRTGKPSIHGTIRFNGNNITGEISLASSTASTPLTGERIGVGLPPGVPSVTLADFTRPKVAAITIDPLNISTEVLPKGKGYLTMSTTSTGVTTFGGKLPDNTAITGSFPLSYIDSTPSNVARFHVPLYGGTGVFAGVLDVLPDSIAGPSTTNPVNELSARWTKKPGPISVRAYRNGFGVSTPVALDVEGFIWTPVGPGMPWRGFPSVTLDAQVELQGARIDSTELHAATGGNGLVPFTEGANKQFVFAPPYSTTYACSFNLVGSTGLWTATMKVDQAGTIRTITGSGIFILVQTFASGPGFFILPKLEADAEHPVSAPNPATNTTQLSGVATFGPRTF